MPSRQPTPSRSPQKVGAPPLGAGWRGARALHAGLRVAPVFWLAGLASSGCPASERTVSRSFDDPLPLLRPSGDPCLALPEHLAPASGTPVTDAAGARAALVRAGRLAQADDWPAAERAYSAALSLDPELGLAHLGLAESLEHTGGSAERRRDHLARALVDLPKNPRAHVRFADALVGSGDRVGGLVHFRCALALKEGLRDARRRAARLALELDGPSAAKPIAAPLLSGSPEPPDWVLAAEIHAADGQPEEAARSMEKAAEQSGSAVLWRRAATLWDRALRPDAAANARTQADAIDPPSRRAMRALPPSRARGP